MYMFCMKRVTELCSCTVCGGLGAKYLLLLLLVLSQVSLPSLCSAVHQTNSTSSVSSKISALVAEAAPPSTSAEAEATLMKAFGVRQLAPNRYELGCIHFDSKSRTITIPVKVNMREQVVEYALVSEGGKLHESIFSTKARPTNIHIAALLLGVRATNSTACADHTISFPAANALKISVQWPRNGPDADIPLSKLIVTRKSIGAAAWYQPPGKSGRVEPATVLSERSWFYKGSRFRSSQLAAQMSGSIIATIADPEALIVNPGADRMQREVQHYPNKDLLPVVGKTVSLVLQF